MRLPGQGCVLNLLYEVQHRPWPVPEGPWVMAQSWHDLLFAHWVLPVDTLRPLIPTPLEIDTHHGIAWMGIAPFRMTGVRIRGIPALPGLSAFPELNVRTYVTLGGKPGVFFFSLDAGSRLSGRRRAPLVPPSLLLRPDVAARSWR